MRTINVDLDGKTIRLGASGNTPFLYMSKMGRDINKDMSKLAKSMSEVEESAETIPFGIEDLKIFASILYVMAYQGAEDKKTFPETPEEFLEELDSAFSIYELLPACFQLWGMNQAQTVETKKNLVKRRGT